MADVQGFLTRKLGPLPVWAWAAAAGGVVSVLYLRGKGQASTPGAPAQDSSGQGLFAPSPIVVTPGTMPAQTSSVNPAPVTSSAPPPAPLWQFGTGFMSLPKGKWVWHVTPGATVPGLPGGQVYPGSSSDPSKVAPNSPAYGWQWAAVPDGMDPTGVPWSDQTYAQALGAAGMGGGGGGHGATSAVKTLPGSGSVGRFTSRHAHPQYVRVGMGGGGRAGLREMSKRTGLPEARLMALNPGHVRPTPGGQPRHIYIR